MAEAVWVLVFQENKRKRHKQRCMHKQQCSFEDTCCDFCSGGVVQSPSVVWVCDKHLVAGRRWLKLQSIRTALPQCQP